MAGPMNNFSQLAKAKGWKFNVLYESYERNDEQRVLATMTIIARELNKKKFQASSVNQQKAGEYVAYEFFRHFKQYRVWQRKTPPIVNLEPEEEQPPQEPQPGPSRVSEPVKWLINGAFQPVPSGVSEPLKWLVNGAFHALKYGTAEFYLKQIHHPRGPVSINKTTEYVEVRVHQERGDLWVFKEYESDPVRQSEEILQRLILFWANRRQLYWT